MKKLPILALLFLSSCFLFQNEDEKPLLKVAETTYTLGKFKNYLEYRPIPAHVIVDEALLNKKAEELVEAEILVQKAKDLELDKEPDIQRQIQRILIDNLLQKKVELPVRSQKISNQEIKDYFDRHNLEFNRPPETKIVEIYNKDKQKIEKALQEVQTGKTNFGVLSRAFSDKHANYPKGRPGYIDPKGKPAGLPQNVVKVAFSMNLGEVSDVISSGDGYRIIMVTGKRPAVKTNWKDKANQIRQKILQERLARKKEVFINELKEDAVVEIDNELIQELAENMKGERTLKITKQPLTPPSLPSN